MTATLNRPPQADPIEVTLPEPPAPPSAAGLSLADTISTTEFTIGALSVTGRGGHMRVMWDTRNAAEVEQARATFDQLRREGHLAYQAAGADSRTGSQLLEFNPEAERIVMVAPLVGG